MNAPLCQPPCESDVDVTAGFDTPDMKARGYIRDARPRRFTCASRKDAMNRAPLRQQSRSLELVPA